MTLEYDGTAFRGWAAQPGERTVEGSLQEALATVFPRWSELAVAGRTDTGVHALGQVASVELDGGAPPDRAAAAQGQARSPARPAAAGTRSPGSACRHRAACR